MSGRHTHEEVVKNPVIFPLVTSVCYCDNAKVYHRVSHCTRTFKCDTHNDI